MSIEKILSTEDAEIKPESNSRLVRFESYLEADPENSRLTADAFEAALTCRDWMRATQFLRHGQHQFKDDYAWALRETELFLAQGDLESAEQTLFNLQTLETPANGFQEVVSQNLAYVSFQRGNYKDCADRLSSVMESAPVNIASSSQIAWLRSLHRLGEMDHALAWAKAQEQLQGLNLDAAGVASLLALDAGDMPLALRWSSQALNQAETGDHAFAPVEALVTQASIALARKDASQARRLASTVLKFNPADGRTWSVMAFAALLDRDLDSARDYFIKALAGIPEHIGTWHGQGWTDILLQDLDAAQLSFETALALDRNFAESHGGLAVVLALKNQSEAAKEHIERAKRLDKANISGRYAEAIQRGEVQDMEALQRLAKRLLEGRLSPLGGAMIDAIVKPSSTDQ